MTSISMAPTTELRHTNNLWGLLRPQQLWLATAITMSALLIGVIGRQIGLPMWQAALPGALIFGVAVIARWSMDRAKYGPLFALMVALVSFQGGHGVEHIMQWLQYHAFGYTLRASTGLISAADTELVHFVWNWGVLLVMARLYMLGMRNPWAYVMLFWSTAHTFEHTYLFVRHLQVLDQLQGWNQMSVTAQGLPGILGRDGWLARSPVTAGTWLCTIPGLTTATRLDVHFWWNVGETVLMMVAATAHISRQRLHNQQ